MKMIDKLIYEARWGEHRIKGKFRWIVFSLGVMFFIFACFLRIAFNAVIAFTLGCYIGFFIDLFGIYCGFWKYTRGRFMKKEYFLTVIPTWGIFSMMINMLWEAQVWSLLVNLEWYLLDAIKTVIIGLALFCLHELPNLKTKSWTYSTRISKYIIFAGWFPLVAGFRSAYVVLPWLGMIFGQA
jgi:hypothetical protein